MNLDIMHFKHFPRLKVIQWVKNWPQLMVLMYVKAVCKNIRFYRIAVIL